MRGIKIERLSVGDEDRLCTIRLRALRDAPEAFATTFADAHARPIESWREQLESLATFVAVADDLDVGVARGARQQERPGAAGLISMWVAPRGARPRSRIGPDRRRRRLGTIRGSPVAHPRCDGGKRGRVSTLRPSGLSPDGPHWHAAATPRPCPRASDDPVPLSTPLVGIARLPVARAFDPSDFVRCLAGSFGPPVSSRAHGRDFRITPWPSDQPGQNTECELSICALGCRARRAGCAGWISRW